MFIFRQVYFFDLPFPLLGLYRFADATTKTANHIISSKTANIFTCTEYFAVLLVKGR